MFFSFPDSFLNYASPRLFWLIKNSENRSVNRFTVNLFNTAYQYKYVKSLWLWTTKL